jgi:hypothetical protein
MNCADLSLSVNQGDGFGAHLGLSEAQQGTQTLGEEQLTLGKNDEVCRLWGQVVAAQANLLRAIIL